MYRQLYMDDLKLYANSMEQLHTLLGIITKFSEPIQINFGIYVSWYTMREDH
jgi:hypothetical protein